MPVGSAQNMRTKITWQGTGLEATSGGPGPCHGIASEGKRNHWQKTNAMFSHNQALSYFFTLAKKNTGT